MCSYWQKKILILIIITLILTIAIPISSAHKRRSKDAEKYIIRDLCSKTEDSDKCWNILKHKFNHSDERDIANNVIELAIAKSKEIREQWFSYSKNDNLKLKYRSCWKNYNEVDRNIVQAQRNLDSDDYRNISDQIDDAQGESDKCRQVFEYDPTRVGDPNHEFGLYLDMVRVAVDRLEDSDG